MDAAGSPLAAPRELSTERSPVAVGMATPNTLMPSTCSQVDHSREAGREAGRQAPFLVSLGFGVSRCSVPEHPPLAPKPLPGGTWRCKALQVAARYPPGVERKHPTDRRACTQLRRACPLAGVHPRWSCTAPGPARLGLGTHLAEVRSALEHRRQLGVVATCTQCTHIHAHAVVGPTRVAAAAVGSVVVGNPAAAHGARCRVFNTHEDAARGRAASPRPRPWPGAPFVRRPPPPLPSQALRFPSPPAPGGDAGHGPQAWFTHSGSGLP